jgi:DnaJ-class molecular chaperone
MLDYYAILEVSSSATTSEVKKSYRRLARLHHPDLNQDALDIHIKRLNEAYEVLRDPIKRTAYDMQCREKQQRAEELAAYKRRQQQVKREPEMTWVEGIIGFVREWKKGLKDE